jgi:hypothetical protein
MDCSRAVRRAFGAACATLLTLVIAAPASAHGEVTGVQDVVQDYGVLLFLVAVVLIGAGVLAWVTFSPQPDEDEDQDDAVPPSPAPTGVAEASETPATPAPATPAPVTPEGSRANR